MPWPICGPFFLGDLEEELENKKQELENKKKEIEDAQTKLDEDKKALDEQKATMTVSKSEISETTEMESEPARPMRIKFDQIPFGLTYENYWTKMTEGYPDQVKKFGDWIDQYKKCIAWNKFFTYHSPEGIKSWKYHDLPLAMQLGIFHQYALECGNIVYLAETMDDLIEQIELHFKWMIHEGK